ncbi:S-layer homology domain-containing protein [Anoxybacillus flavithermus]|nr:S-layer homology domain-containing protein [Anoxybacillus flavithermus]MBE2932303.1 S-layer homology domain-containing protein [Anoxybacillus flavithermus]
MTNSTYVVVEGTHTFGAIKQHWAKGYIETLAAKQLVKGMTETAYRPNEQMTRAPVCCVACTCISIAT